MKKIGAGDLETHSADIVSHNIETLKQLFPEAVTEGKIDFGVLRQLLGGGIDDNDEKYGLNWHGKKRARQLALTPSTGTLRPCPEESVDWATTQNLMIEGDNLEVLKLLQKSYAGKVKLIYIDPPYNTGRDFVYKDDYQDNIKNYLMLTGQVDSDGRKISTNAESSGRFHTDWLNMIYPRLRVAKELLAETGVMFVSVDDNEIGNVRLVLDEVFGQENFVATAIWQKVYAPKNSAKHFSEDHDYLLVYARNGDRWRPELLARTAEMEGRYENPDNDPRGPWKPGDLSARNYYSAGTYAITCRSGRVIDAPPAGRYWVVKKERLLELDADGRIWWGKDGNNVPSLKRFLSEVKQGRVPQTLWFYKDVGHNQESKKELLDVLPLSDSDSVFDTPKPTRLVRRMLELSTSEDQDDVVLDFFAGSGTTGHAVMLQNAADGGRRRYICVQLPAALVAPAVTSDGTAMSTIAEMTEERLRRSGARLREEKPMFAGDLGFRLFKLASSNVHEWEATSNDLTSSLESAVEHLKTDRTEADILYELLLKLGLDLCVPIEKRVIAGKDVHAVGGGVLIACLTPKIARDDAEALALGIAEWHKSLAPAGEATCVFRDSAFEDDVAKTNVAAILEQHGLTNVKSL